MTTFARRLAWRTGRALYQRARRETRNDARLNGEHRLIELVTRHAPAGPLTFIDIGANTGDWSAHAREVTRRDHRACRVYVCEPTPDAFASLTARFAADESVVPSRTALSSSDGEATMWLAGRRSSLHPTPGAREVTVPVRTLRSFVAEHGITHIALLKSDAEGHDVPVLEGGLDLLQRGLVDVWQFEYNHRWLENRTSLRDVFGLVAGTPYRLAHLSADGLEIHDSWHWELDRFFETHFVLIRRGSFCEPLAAVVRFNAANVPERLTRPPAPPSD